MNQPTDLNRRTLMKVGAGAAASVLLGANTARTSGAVHMLDDGFIDVRRSPDSVAVITEDGLANATKAGDDRWQISGVEIQTAAGPELLKVTMSAPGAAVKQIRLRWKGSANGWKNYLGDHWERSYGDLYWRAIDTPRTSPWYVMLQTANGTHGVGVRTQPNAFCSWQHDTDGLLLICDVRSGGVGVRLGDRVLHVCDVTARKGNNDETPFAATVAFCKQMCPNPKMPDHVVYGFNDWYYAYGKNTPAGLLADTEMLTELSSNTTNRPYSVIDDGWQTKTKVKDGQWSDTRPTFGSMAELAADMKKLNVRPGIWMRPLIDEIKAWPESWHAKRDSNFLDPTLPEVKQIVANDIRRIREWGYEMIKHDFSTIDIVGRWGKDMHGTVTSDGWSFAHRNQTTAEIINDLYKTIRDAAGPVVIIGCNTVSHLTAGVFELNRIGDDTSGNEWHRNPQMGVNTLAFRAAHQANFYGADADCCPITQKIEWKRTRQWLDLVARSGTPLFVSLDRKAATEQVKQDLRAALTIASQPLPLGEPLDWMTSRTPREWKLNGERVTYDWS